MPNKKFHHYETYTFWTGNLGDHTKNYRGYSRDHISFGKHKTTNIFCSSDPQFRGTQTKYNPEELFVIALSNCHMLWYLHLCTTKKIEVTNYEDRATGEMEEDSDGKGRFVKVVLHPRVTIATGNVEEALSLHEEAHKYCFIANSVRFPVLCQPEIYEKP